MEKTSYSCCFTGHRTIKKEHIVALRNKLEETLEILIRSGTDTFRTGGAMGFDTLAALCVLDKREEYPHIKLELCLPCRNQTAKWREDDIRIYEEILSRADKVTYLHDTYINGCMLERNRFMVDGCDYCIAYFTHPRGGTEYTVNYAKKKQVKLVNLATLI